MRVLDPLQRAVSGKSTTDALVYLSCIHCLIAWTEEAVRATYFLVTSEKDSI